MKKSPKLIRLLNAALPFVTLAFLLIVWLITAKSIGSNIIFPPVSLTFNALLSLFSKPSFYLAVTSTFLRAIAAFVISFVIASLLALLAFKYPIAKKLLSPIIIIAKAIPTMAIILLVVIWVKSTFSPIIIASSLVFPMQYSLLLTGLKNIDNDLIDMAKIFKVPKKKLLKLCYKEILPSTLDVASSTLGLSLKVTISSEVIAFTQRSMGSGLQLSNIELNTAALLAWTIVAILIGLFIEIAFYYIRRGIIKWKI